MKAVERLRVSTTPSNIAYLALLFLILCASIEALPTIYRLRTDDRLQRTQRAKELAPPSFMKRNDPSSTSSMPSYVYLYEVPAEQPLNEPPHVNELYGVLRNF
uniref:Uncharacterized protein n=1 Tax=Acrobeloides nanus TaxID=290746 RepID=A0A914E6B3_9BILA